MREIKFRVWSQWSKEDGKMVYLDRFYLLDGGIAWITTKNYDKLGMTNISDTIMQYTGLKDKNGKEIYEGDILQYKIDFQPKKDKSKMYTVVELDNLLDGLLDIQYDEYSNFNCDRNTLEVIGNIYENPELLNSN